MAAPETIETRYITGVTIEHDAIFVSDGKKKEWLGALPSWFTTAERETIHKILQDKGFRNFDNRHLVIAAIQEHLEKTRKKDQEKQFRFDQAAILFKNYLEMADDFLQKQPIFFDKTKIWWAWNFENYCWKRIDETDIANAIYEKYDISAITKEGTKSEILNALRMKGRKNKPLEAKKTWVQFKKKIIDLATGDEFEASPEYFVTNPIPWDLGETEDTPTIDKFFVEWVGEKYARTLLEIVSFVVVSDYPLHRIFCLVGAGRNGKTTFLNLLTHFVGLDNTVATDMEQLVESNFESSRLFRKLLCVMGEINTTIFKRTNTIKKLVGDDLMRVEFKGKDGFDSKNYAKILIATNKLPETTDKTAGFYSKWVIVDFPNQFKENPYLLDTVPEIEYSNLARKCLRVLKEVLNAGLFSNEGSFEEKEVRYEERASPLREFLLLECETGRDFHVPLWEIFEAYSEYLAQRNFRSVKKRELTVLLENKGFRKDLKHFTNAEGRESTRYEMLGLRLKGIETDMSDTKDAYFPITSSIEKSKEKYIYKHIEHIGKDSSNAEKTVEPPKKSCSICSNPATVCDGDFSTGTFYCTDCWTAKQAADRATEARQAREELP
jgi:P4 family phage/plasmid primase-like protien